MTSTSSLRAHWDRLAAAVPALDDELRDDLVARYGEGHRCYHTTEHLEQVVGTATWLAEQEQLHDPAPVLLAAWFHDAVYDPRAADNEAASAALAERELAARSVHPALIGETARLVLATATHQVHDPAAAVLLDADLAVLASDRDDYHRYAAAIREEYAHVPDHAFRAGRATILERLLARPVFATATMRTREAAARANLRRELTALRLPRSR